MKNLYSIKIKEKETIRYEYFRSYSIKHLIFCLEVIWEYYDWKILQIKRLKRIYRKNISITEV